MRAILAASVIACWAACPSPALAGVTFLDPTPYLSSQDSPLDMSGLGSTFFLEDFEDGVWDLPTGVSEICSTIGNPGTFTDSVDADDGIIDGNGSAGHSMIPVCRYFNFTNPLTQVTFFQLTFDVADLGFVPNAFGAVWTDGVPGSWLNISAHDENNLPIGFRRFDALMDSSHTGDTTQDRFVGFVSDIPFNRVTIGNSYRSNVRLDLFEVDHIQFGLVIPEPASLYCLLCVVLATIMILHRARKEFCHERIRKGGGSFELNRWSRGCCVLLA